MEVIGAALCFMFATVGMVFIVRLTQIESKDSKSRKSDEKITDEMYEAYMKGARDAHEGRIKF